MPCLEALQSCITETGPEASAVGQWGSGEEYTHLSVEPSTGLEIPTEIQPMDFNKESRQLVSVGRCGFGPFIK